MSKNENPILVDIYGTEAPAAAVFNKGAASVAEIKDAAEKQQRQTPGAYHQTTPKKD